MRNLKKVLCLVLSLAMMLSVMVMGTGAVYTDQASIKNTEAVDVLTALNILEGYQDGSFRPNKVVTRAEMAKIITFILNGGSKATIGSADVSTFSDMNGHWALNEVEYCVSKGIIDGYPNGTFRPENTVTGTEAAKMLLTALNYDGAVFGYVGNNWAINVNVDATKAGLYEDLGSIDPSQGMARDNVAQMVYNMLNANMMEKKISRVVNGDITYSYDESDVTAMEKFFGAETRSGVLVNIYYNKDTGEYTYYLVDADWFDKNGVPENFMFDGKTGEPRSNAKWADRIAGFTSKTDYSDLFGQNVTVLAKSITTKGSGEYSYDFGKLFGMYVNKGGVVTTGVWVDVDRGSNDYSNTIEINDVKYRLDNVSKNSPALKVVGYNQFNSELYTSSGAIDEAKVLPQYSFTAIDIDGGGDIDLFVVYPYYVLRVDKTAKDYFRVNMLNKEDDQMLWVNKATQDELLLDYDNEDGLYKTFTGDPVSSLNGKNALYDDKLDPDVEWDDVQVNGDLVKDSYVQAIPAKYTAQGEDIYNVLTVKNDKATAMKTADYKITLAGKVMDGALLDEEITSFKTLHVGDSYSYVEVNSYLFWIDDEDASQAVSEYVVVTDSAIDRDGYLGGTTGTLAKTYQAELLFTDGTTKEVDIAADKTEDQAFIGYLYTYEVNSKGNYELTAVKTVNDFPAPENFDDPTQEEQFAAFVEDSAFDHYEAYQWGAPFNENDYGVRGIYDTDKAGGFFYCTDSAEYQNYLNDYADWEDGIISEKPDMADYGIEKHRIADDAVIFAYNYIDDEYTVLKGSDLEDFEYVNDIYWSFTGANDEVELGYVAVPWSAGSSVVYAYVSANPERSQDDNKDWYVTFEAYTDPGDTKAAQTFETRHQDDEDTWLQRDAYALEKNDYVKLTLNKAGEVCNVESAFIYIPGPGYINIWGQAGEVNGDLTGKGSTKSISIDGTDYFIDGDTTVLFVDDSGRKDFTEIQDGDYVFYVADDDDITVIYIISEADYQVIVG